MSRQGVYKDTNVIKMIMSSAFFLVNFVMYITNLQYHIISIKFVQKS
jgi:hypothetical protein